MTYRCLLQMVLLLCLSTTALCRSYSLLRFQQGRSLEVCQKLLRQLPSTPQHCLEFRMDFQMPEEMKQAQQFRKEDAVLVMYEMLQHIFNILTRDFSSTGWSDTIIEHLLEELYGQMNRLEPIQKEIMQKQNSTMGDTTVLRLKKYYFNLGQYLKAKEHNSWGKMYTTLHLRVLQMFLLHCELCAVGASASHTRDSLHKARRQRKERLSTFSLSLHSIRALGRDPEGRGGNVSSDNVMKSMASENLPQGSTRRRLSQPSSSRIFPMAFVLSLLMALVLVSYGPGGSLGCDLSQNHVLFGKKNLRLLGQMRRISPRFCLQDRKEFAFPQEMVEGSQLQEAQAISVLHEMLQQSFNLFHTERSSAAWNTTLLEQLRTGLHQQLDHLDACLGQVMGEEDSALRRTGPTLAVKRYFQGIHVYLQEKGYSDCAWETIRVEIMRSLSSSASL
ncbi:hypothetical protein MJG53_003282 [Ovis ammon polii x Ovis aries]|uniref:Uncharacterized protein n=1 Tax=Ovis ammon polii x Ovis aries TaxID=2918886 RepID=A0ACB9VFT9_9CETA|nr:hypothetical protein MJG53_003282 [Ovis ammon polii x Ovis aries]